MKKLLDRAAIVFFSCYAKARGYKFSLVTTAGQNAAAEKIFDEGGYKLPVNFADEMEPYKEGAVKFIAYHKNKPVGTVGLADPKVANRPFHLHSIDEKGEHFEIRGLVVSKEHRDCTQLVLLGLFKEMYIYSTRNAIRSWISLGLKSLYLTMRRYNRNIQMVTITENNYRMPIAAYMYKHNIFDSCSVMNVADFSPYKICAKFIRKRAKKLFRQY